MEKILALLLIFLMKSVAFAQTPAVFIINTQEHDRGGSTSVYYLDEYYAIEKWKNIAPEAKIIMIRAESNEQITRSLEAWIKPDPKKYVIIGLEIISHGNYRTLANENRKFHLLFPEGLGAIFSPLKNSYALGARVVLDGCEVISRMSSEQIKKNLKVALTTLGIAEGEIYASQTDFYEVSPYYKNNPFNSDIPLEKRIRFLVGNALVFPPLVTYALQKFYNSGVLLRINSEGVQTQQLDFEKTFEIPLSLHK